jgi:hypothetical protein
MTTVVKMDRPVRSSERSDAQAPFCSLLQFDPLRHRRRGTLTVRGADADLHVVKDRRGHSSPGSPHNKSAHWLRHTTLTWVERNFGYAVARAYAGHSGGENDASTTT